MGIVTFAAAWHGGLSGAQQFTNDATLRSAISLAMGFWFADDFTDPSCIDSGGDAACPCGTPGFWNSNWFSNVHEFPSPILTALTRFFRLLVFRASLERPVFYSVIPSWPPNWGTAQSSRAGRLRRLKLVSMVSAPSPEQMLLILRVLVLTKAS